VGELAHGSALDADELHARTAGNPFFVDRSARGDSEVVPETVPDAVLARVSTGRVATGAGKLDHHRRRRYLDLSNPRRQRIPGRLERGEPSFVDELALYRWRYSRHRGLALTRYTDYKSPENGSRRSGSGARTAVASRERWRLRTPTMNRPCAEPSRSCAR
jgi:hypothetical protein